MGTAHNGNLPRRAAEHDLGQRYRRLLSGELTLARPRWSLLATLTLLDAATGYEKYDRKAADEDRTATSAALFDDVMRR